MNHGTPTKGPQALSAKLAKEEPEYIASWRAIETLLANADVAADAELYDRLSVLQERWETETLARHGMPRQPRAKPQP